MSHQPSDIDKLFKEELYDYAPMPDAKVWQNLEQKLEANNASRKSPVWSLLALLGIGIAVASMLLYNNANNTINQDDAVEVQNLMKTAKPNANSDNVSTNVNNNSSSTYFASTNATVNAASANAPLVNTISNTKSSILQRNQRQRLSQSAAIASGNATRNVENILPFSTQQDDEKIESHKTVVSSSLSESIEDIHTFVTISRLPLTNPSMYEMPSQDIILSMNAMPIMVRKNATWKLATIGLQLGQGNAYRTLHDADVTDVNKKYFNQYESKGNAWSAGLGLTFQKSRHWSIQTGLTYTSSSIKSNQSLNAIYNANGLSEGIYSTSFNNSTVNFVPTNLEWLKDGDLLYYPIKATQTTTQVNLPVTVAYKMYVGRLGIELGLGGQASVIVGQKLGIDNGASFFKQYLTNNAENNKKIYWATLCKFQLSYPISGRYDWQIGAQYDFANSAANRGKSVQYLPFHKYITTGLSMHF